MYSQNEEEKHIVEYFQGRTGNLLDIGAFDGTVFSNTLRLIQLGWSGVLVEPSPGPFEALKKLHEDNGAVVTVNAAVVPVAGEIDFYDTNGDAVSTTNLEHKAKWENGSSIKFELIKVRGITAKDIIDAYGAQWDFVNIDTENTNIETLKALVAAGLKFELLCIEHDNQHPAIVEMFPGCQPIYQNAENLIVYYKR